MLQTKANQYSDEVLSYISWSMCWMSLYLIHWRNSGHEKSDDAARSASTSYSGSLASALCSPSCSARWTTRFVLLALFMVLIIAILNDGKWHLWIYHLNYDFMSLLGYWPAVWDGHPFTRAMNFNMVHFLQAFYHSILDLSESIGVAHALQNLGLQ